MHRSTAPTADALAAEDDGYAYSWQPERHDHPLPDAAPLPPAAGDGALPSASPADAAR